MTTRAETFGSMARTTFSQMELGKKAQRLSGRIALTTWNAYFNATYEVAQTMVNDGDPQASWGKNLLQRTLQSTKAVALSGLTSSAALGSFRLAIEQPTLPEKFIFGVGGLIGGWLGVLELHEARLAAFKEISKYRKPGENKRNDEAAEQIKKFEIRTGIVFFVATGLLCAAISNSDKGHPADFKINWGDTPSTAYAAEFPTSAVMEKYTSPSSPILDKETVEKTAFQQEIIEAPHLRSDGTISMKAYEKSQWQQVLKYYDLIAQEARRRGLNGEAVKLMLVIALAESGGNPEAVYEESIGLFQINEKLSAISREELFDPENNIQAGFSTMFDYAITTYGNLGEAAPIEAYNGRKSGFPSYTPYSNEVLSLRDQIFN